MHPRHAATVILGAALLFTAPLCPAAEIPVSLAPAPGGAAATLRAAGLPAEEADRIATGLDGVEQAALAQADLRAQGGALDKEEREVFFVIVVLLAIILVATV